jgi:hypothetical protein
MQLQADDIAEFFDEYGWRYERRSDGLFRSGFQGDTGHYEIWIRVSDEWVYLTITPFVAKPDDEDHPPAVLEALLRSNYELNLAKFALDEDGDILLTVELPREGFDYSHFADSLTALSHYADLYKERFEHAAVEIEHEVV